MNVWGNKLKISIFGESHGDGVGAIVDGIPSGTRIDLDFINFEMQRRAPGRDKFSTPRKEPDKVEILSGVVDGFSTGTPICGIIRSTNTRSTDYQKDIIRPGHADFTGFMKYGKTHDFRGGGHFSGRVTAALVFAGALSKLVLSAQGVTIGAHIKRIGNVSDKAFLECEKIDKELLCGLTQNPFPTICRDTAEKMKNVILEAVADKNSVGGIIECASIGVPIGIGSPFFASLESLIASIMFSVPAVKGIEFGKGFEMAHMTGYEANDEFYTDGKNIKTRTNNNGGINGGISNGMPIVFSVAVKPTPSIGRQQHTVDMANMENTELEIKGRHDPCIVQRAVAVVESGMAIALLEGILFD